jgi:hypothetical protein
VLRQLKQARNRISTIEQELTSLRTSEIALLRQDVEQAQDERRDLIAEIESTVRVRIARAKDHYATMKAQVKGHGR